MTPETKNKIQRILNYIESGSQNGNYAAISLYNDGPNQIKQITFGKSQTTEWGNLNKLISLYVENNGKFADELKPYLQKIGKISLVNDANLLSILKKLLAQTISCSNLKINFLTSTIGSLQ